MADAFTLNWDQEGQKFVEAGVDRGVLYVYDENSSNSNSNYAPGVAWSGLTSVSDSPSGAEANKQYADNIVYANLRGAEEYGGSIEAFTYPDAWKKCNGEEEPADGVVISQQNRSAFGFAYRTLIGSDKKSLGDAGYKLHLVYGATVSPSEATHETINESPEGETFSWEFDTVPVPVTGYKPTSKLTIDSRKTPRAKLDQLEAILYGSGNDDPYLPMPDDVIELIGTSNSSEVEPAEPGSP